MNNKIDFVKMLVPIVAIVVIFESVMLIQNLTNTSVTTKETVKPVAVETKKEETPVFNLNIKSEKVDIKLADKLKVTVVGNSLKGMSADAVSLFVKYDPEAVTISNLVGGKALPKPTFSKISVKTGYVVANYFITDVAGLVMEKDKDIDLITFDIKPKKEGILKFEFGTGSDMTESVTMIVDNATRKAVPYSSNKLEINVGK